MQSVLNQVSLYTSSITGGSTEQRRRESDHVYVTDVTFNQDHSSFLVGTTAGFRIFNSDPVAQIKKYEPIPGLERQGGVNFLHPLFRTKFLILVVSGEPEKLYVFDKAKGGVGGAIGSFVCRRPILNIAIARRVIAIVTDKTLHCLCPDTIKESSQDAVDNPRGVLALARSCPKGWIVAVPSTKSGCVQIRSTYPAPSHFLSSNQYNDSMDLHLWDFQAFDSGIVQAIAFNSTGSLIAVANETGTLVRVFRMSDCTLLNELHRSQRHAVVGSIVFSPNDSILAVSSSSGTVHLFALPTCSSSSASSFDLSCSRWVSDPIAVQRLREQASSLSSNRDQSVNNNNNNNSNNSNNSAEDHQDGSHSQIHMQNNNNFNLYHSSSNNTMLSSTISTRSPPQKPQEPPSSFFGSLTSRLKKDFIAPISGVVASAVSKASDTVRTRLTGDRSFAQVKVCLNDESNLDVRDPQLSIRSFAPSASPFCGPVIGFIPCANNKGETDAPSSATSSNQQPHSGSQSNNNNNNGNNNNLNMTSGSFQQVQTPDSTSNNSSCYPWKLLVITQAGVAFRISVTRSDAIASLSDSAAAQQNSSNAVAAQNRTPGAVAAPPPSMLLTAGSVLLSSFAAGWHVSAGVAIDDITQWMATRPNYVPPVFVKSVSNVESNHQSGHDSQHQQQVILQQCDKKEPQMVDGQQLSDEDDDWCVTE